MLQGNRVILSRTMQRLFMITTLLVALFTATGHVSAHVDLVSATPAKDARLTTAPDKVALVFSAELKSEGNVIQVTDASGNTVDNGDTALDKNDSQRATIVVTLKSGLGDGVYTVKYTYVASDGHAETERYTFTVGTSASTASAAGLPTTGADHDLSLVILLMGALLLLGAGWALRQRTIH